MQIKIWVSLVFLFLTTIYAQALEKVDLELVLLADASTSIDEKEIFLQRKGYADAMVNKEVLSAITGGWLRKIAVTYIEWGDASSQEVVVPWMVIEDFSSAEEFGKRLMSAPRLAFGRNSIGNAITKAHIEIESNNI